ncbi:MAG: helix-turn-helix transcriptional regulator, partial [Clostridium sp.]|nr:helix-turn-helix transcriptional regulator [Clostridium sp.]
MNIADRIQHLRKTKGLSQEELADHIGVSRQAVSK